MLISPFLSSVGSGDLTRWDLAGFPWDWLVLESLEQLNFVLVSFSFSLMFAGASI
jgi:hypothetical protein